MLGEIPWLSWKNKATREREAAEYAAWAFPYGDEQRTKVTDLLMEMLPKEDRQTIIIPYLTVKEVYSNYVKTPGMEEIAKERIWKALKRYKGMMPTATIPYYLALAIVDVKINEDLAYPPASVLKANAEQLLAEKKARDEAEKNNK